MFGTARKQTEQALRYGSVLQAAASITAHLRLDLAAMAIPAGSDGAIQAVEISPDGKTLGFMRDDRPEDLDDVPASGPGRHWIDWTTEEGPGGSRILVRRREAGGETRWASTAVKDLGFALVTRGYATWVVVELHLLPEGATAAGPGTRAFPLRVVQRLRPPALLPDLSVAGYPSGLLGDLPEPGEPPPPFATFAPIAVGVGGGE